MAEQKESEKLVRGALKRVKHSQNIFLCIEICLLIGMVVTATAIVVYGQTARPNDPQIDMDDAANKCVSCMNTTVAEDCKVCITGFTEAINYDAEFTRYDNIDTALVYLLLMLYILILYLEGFFRKGDYIKQLKIEHALEIDKLKKRRK